MDILVTSKLVANALLARKGRAFLTILGIVIGVAGVIIIIALGAGAQSLILGQVTKLGTDLLSVQPGKSNEKGPPAQLFGIVITTLIDEDAIALQDKSRVPHAKAITGLVQGAVSVIWQNKTIDTNFAGVNYTYPDVVAFTMDKGQFFNQQEDQGNTNVVILGASVAEQLFENTEVDPIGQIIKVKSSSQTEVGGNSVGGIPLRVLGVVASRGSSFFQDMDDQIFMPLKIGQQQLLGIRYLQSVNIKIDSSENVDQTVADVTSVLKQRHHIRQYSDIDFTIRNIADAVDILSTITDALRLFLTSMAAIALVVGGIGILNIMMSTVAERTREIGLRKAVGATNRAILGQFLLEAGALTSFGGITGIAVGAIISFLMSLLMSYLGYDWAFIISPGSVLMAVGVSVLTGVLFGLYPAFKASRLNPIDALRYE